MVRVLFCCSEKRVTGTELHAGKVSWLQEKEDKCMEVGRTLEGSSVFLEDNANMVGERRARGRESLETKLKGTT